MPPATPPRRPLGRDTDLTMATRAHWSTLFPVAPRVFAGVEPEESPPIYEFCPGGFQNQWIGECVGCGTANGAGTILRIPDDAEWDPDDPDSLQPLPSTTLSALWSYYWARNINGPSNFPEGAVVAYSLDGARKRGYVLDETWPNTQGNQMAYSDKFQPTPTMLAEGASHLAIQAARITSAAQWREFEGQGFPIIFGIPIGSGWMQTAEDGRISMAGKSIGGHCMLSVGYSKKKNRRAIRNSWMNWGLRDHHPEFADANGYRNVGYADLDEFEKRFCTPQAFQSASTDAFVVSDIAGFDQPKIKIRSAVELFT